MKKSNPYRYGEGVPMQIEESYSESIDCGCKKDPRFRTDYADTMEPSRGPRTYPSVRIIEGR